MGHVVPFGLSTSAWGTIVVTLGVLWLTPDTTLIQLVKADVEELLFWRASAISFGSLVMLLLSKKGSLAAVLEDVITGSRHTPLICFLFSLSGVSFTYAVVMTGVAAALVIWATAPLQAALFSRIILKEAIPWRTRIAILTGLAAIAIIFASDIEDGWTGKLVALCGASSAALMLVQFRRVSMREPNASVLPAYIFSFIPSCAFALCMGARPADVEIKWDALYLFLQGCIVMPVSFFSLAYGARFIPAAEVGLLMLLETIIGPIWAYLVLDEKPPKMTFVGGGLLVVGLVVNSVLGIRAERQQHLAAENAETELQSAAEEGELTPVTLDHVGNATTSLPPQDEEPLATDETGLL